MRKLNVKVRPLEMDVCFYPEDFCKIQFLGVETKSGDRYFRTNWASAEDNSAFWYPFCGGITASVWNTVRSTKDMQGMLDSGCTFYFFATAKSLYLWMANAHCN